MFTKYPFGLHGYRYPDPDPNTTPTPDPSANKPWYDGFQNAEVKTWLGSMPNAYPNPEAVAMKAYNLEKFVGAEKAGHGVVIPKADAKPEERLAFWRRVGGVPEKEDGYPVPKKFENDPYIKALRAEAHKMGMPMDHWKGQMQWYESHSDVVMERERATFEQKAESDWTELRTSWGTNYDKKVETARRAAQSFLPAASAEERKEQLNKIEAAIGTKNTMLLFASVGDGISEHQYVQGDNTGDQGHMTVEGARLKIENLKKDVDFGKKLLNGDATSRAEWDRLHRIGYGA